MITLDWLYTLAGAMFAAIALLSALDPANKKRFGNAAFWGLMALSLLAGDRIGDFGNGLLVLGLAGLAGFGFIGRSHPPTTGDEERQTWSDRLGNKLFLPALIISVVGLAVMVAGGINFWRHTRGTLRDFLDPGAIFTAAGDALGLRYQMGGGAGGCPYPQASASFARWVLHHLTFWGFLSAFLATCIAYVHEHFQGWYSPFPILSGPVIFGSQ